MSVIARFVDAFVAGFFRTMKEKLIDGGLLLATLVYWLFTGKLSAHFWESVAPWIWVTCGIVSWHAVSAARLLLREVRTEQRETRQREKSLVLSQYGEPYELPKAEVPKYRARLLGLVVVIVTICIGFSYATWQIANREVIRPEPGIMAESQPIISLNMDCILEGFPVRIPPGESIHVLRVHPQFMQPRFPGTKTIELEDVFASTKVQRIWPSADDAKPLPLRPHGKDLVPNFDGLRCTVKKVGGGALDQISIPIWISAYSKEPYELVIDPLDNGDKFVFHILNGCYADPLPGTWEEEPPLFGHFGREVAAHIIGERYRRKIPLTLVYRVNKFPGGIFLIPASYRHWKDLPRC